MTSKVDAPDGIQYVKQKVEDIGVAIPARAAVIVLEVKAGINDPEEIQNAFEYLRDHDEEITVIEEDGTVANRAWTEVQLTWDGEC